MNMMTVPHTNGSANGMQKVWLRSTVEEFFSSVNWEDRPIEVVEPKQDLEESSGSKAGQALRNISELGLSLTMTVDDFFNAFPWEGKPIIAEPIPVQETSSGEPEDDANDITLDDFSGLF